MERNYQFRQDLLRVHTPDRRMEWARPQDSDVFVDNSWQIVLPQGYDRVLYTAARDLQDYFARSMGVFLSVSDTPGKARNIFYLLDPSMDPRDYRLTVQEDAITLTGASPRFAARAGYLLEDLMNQNEGPFVGVQNTLRHVALSPRMIHSGYALDDYPDAYLQKMIHDGFDAILVYVDGVNQTPTHPLDFNELIYRAARYGIDVYVYSRLRSRVYPEGEDGYAFYDGLYGELFRRCPGFKGVFLVGESVEFPSRDPNTSGMLHSDNRGPDGRRIIKKTNPGWWPCQDFHLWMDMVHRVIRKVRPDADIVVCTYNWGYCENSLRKRLIDSLPNDVSVLPCYGMHECLVKDGVDYKIADYSMNYTAPGHYFTTEAQAVAPSTRRLYTTNNLAGFTWDIGTVPYQPVAYRWIERIEHLRQSVKEYGLCGSNDAHHWGWHPNFVSELAKWGMEDADCDLNQVLRRLIERDFSSETVDEVLSALKNVSDACEFIVPTDQYGPCRVGPSYPLLLQRDFTFLSRSGMLHGGNMICDPFYSFDMSNESKLFYATLDWYSQALSLCDCAASSLKDAVEKLPVCKQAKASRFAGIVAFIANTLRTTVHVKQWFEQRLVLENAAASSGEKRRAALKMKEIAQKEIENARNTIPLVEADSRLGFEPSMDYMCDKEHLLLKIEHTKMVVDRQLSVYLEG